MLTKHVHKPIITELYLGYTPNTFIPSLTTLNDVSLHVPRMPVVLSRDLSRVPHAGRVSASAVAL